MAAGRRGRNRVRFRLSEAATVTARLERRRGPRWSGVRAFSRRRGAGRRTLRFTARRLRPGRYRVVLRAQDRARNRSRRVSRSFRVVR